MKSTIHGTERPSHSSRRIGRGLALISALTVLVILTVTGCTSDEPNLVGTALVADHVDTVLFAMGADEVTHYSALRVENNPDPTKKYDGITVDKQEVLYMGEQGGTRSGAIIANFDFSDIFSDEYPEELFTEENISAVKFSLTKLKFYTAFNDTGTATGKPVDLYYQVQVLENPFNPVDYENYPVAPVSGVGPFLNSDFGTPNSSNEPLMRFWDSSDLLGWITNREKVGIIITFGLRSDPGLVGFASKELRHFNELDPLFVGTVPEPNFIVEFKVGPDEHFLLATDEDTSTFDQVPEAPADVDSGFLLRTGLRSYPALYFDLSALPPRAFINRALLSVTNDPTAGFGNLSSIAVLEWDVARFGDPYRTMEITELWDAGLNASQRYSYHVTGARSLDPYHMETIQFDVTQAILRIINQVYTGTRGLILTGAEDFFPEGSAEVDPDFYYREFRFKGTAAADQTHRPQLKITYSVVNDLDGEEK